MTSTNFDANVELMKGYNHSIAQAIGYSESVQKGDICLGFQGEKLVIVENANSIFTKIANLFKGIRVINKETLEENKNILTKVKADYLEAGTFSLGVKGNRFVIVINENSLSERVTKAFKASSLVVVNNHDSIITSIGNIFRGVSSNISKVKTDTEEMIKIESSANLPGKIVNGALLFAGIALFGAVLYNSYTTVTTIVEAAKTTFTPYINVTLNALNPFANAGSTPTI